MDFSWFTQDTFVLLLSLLKKGVGLVKVRAAMLCTFFHRPRCSSCTMHSAFLVLLLFALGSGKHLTSCTEQRRTRRGSVLAPPHSAWFPRSGCYETSSLLIVFSLFPAQRSLVSFSLSLTPPEQLLLTFDTDLTDSGCDVSKLTLQNSSTIVVGGSYSPQVDYIESRP